VAVEGGADRASARQRSDDVVDDVFVDLDPGPSGAVVPCERERPRPRVGEPGSPDGVGEEVADLVGLVERVSRLGREVDAEADARPDDGERPGRSGLLRLA
jgi:hypothetical protein